MNVCKLPMQRLCVCLALVWLSVAQACQDDHESCARWATGGECEANPNYMLASCRLSCGTCCEDNHPECEEWARNGKCQARPADVRRKCPKSCGICNVVAKDPRCEDKTPACRRLTKAGACVHDVTMLEKCPRTCRLCGPGDECRASSDRGVFVEDGMEHFFQRLDSGAFQELGVRVVHRNPWIVVFDHFLTKPHADEVLSQFESGWARSTAGGLVGQDSEYSVRTSETIWCQTAECEGSLGMSRLLSRVENVTGIHRSKFEDTQLLRYMPGQRYAPHNDWIEDQNRLASGPRLMTFFVYLADVPDGGTHFPKLNITLNATKGSAALWNNVDSRNIWQDEPLSEHEGLPPSVSEKYAANVWIHQHDFKSYNDMGCFLADRHLRFKEKIVDKHEL